MTTPCTPPQGESSASEHTVTDAELFSALAKYRVRVRADELRFDREQMSMAARERGIARTDRRLSEKD